MLDTSKQNRFDFNDALSTTERGLQLVLAKFESVEAFDLSVFDGFDEIRILTYSTSTPMIVRMLGEYSFQHFECVFGSEAVLGDVAKIIASQQLLINQVRTCALDLEDKHQRIIFEHIHSGKAEFYVVKDNVAHSKIYLLNTTNQEHIRVIVGSANFSERALGGQQAEALVMFDDDRAAWEHYCREYTAVKETASNHIDFPVDLKSAEIEFTETPALQVDGLTVCQAPQPKEMTSAQVAEKIEDLARPIESIVSPKLIRENGNIVLTPTAKREIKSLRWQKGQHENPEARPTNLTIHRESGLVCLSRRNYQLVADETGLRRSAAAIVEYFNNYESGFIGDVSKLQRDYFTFMSWLYISPFICDLRAQAVVNGSNIFHYPSVAVIYGKANSGKTSLVDTLITSMFEHPNTIEKDSFTRMKLRGLQQNYGRFPVVFDDIDRRRFTNHGLDIIKDELLPPVTAHSSFIISMNADAQSFPDEVVKRCFMTYANTSLPLHNSDLMDKLQCGVEDIRSRLTTDLYRRYLTVIIDELDSNPLPSDILSVSSQTICEILEQFTDTELPRWCRPVTWSNYADNRYERTARRLDAMLAPENYTKSVSDRDQGWTFQSDKICVWAKADTFGRTSIKGEIPDFLYDDTASVGGTFVLWREQTEQFLGRKIAKPRFKLPLVG